MAEKPKRTEPDSENMTRFKPTLMALVAVPKDEASAAYLKKNLSTPKRLMVGGKIGNVEPEDSKSHRRKPDGLKIKKKSEKTK